MRQIHLFLLLLASASLRQALAHSLPSEDQHTFLIRSQASDISQSLDDYCGKADAKMANRIAQIQKDLQLRPLTLDEVCRDVCTTDGDHDKMSRKDAKEMLEHPSRRDDAQRATNPAKCEVLLNWLESVRNRYHAPLPKLLASPARGAGIGGQHPVLRELMGVLQRVETIAQAEYPGEAKLCPMPDGSQFKLVGHLSPEHPSLGKHDVSSQGMIRDVFASSYSIEYQGAKVATKLAHHDDHPDCLNYGTDGSVVYAMTDNAVLRFKRPGGHQFGAVLAVSTDSGRTFSDNIHPDAPGVEPARTAFQRFGYHRSRFQVREGQYQLEITNPLNFNDFLLFVSADAGKTWQVSEASEEPTVFTKAEVNKWRDQFAFDAWINKKFKATTEVCRQHPGMGCASETDTYWSEQWQSCRKQHSGRECLASLPEPEPRFTESK